MSVSGHEWFVNGVSETARKNEGGNQRKHLSHLRRTTIQSRSEREKTKISGAGGGGGGLKDHNGGLKTQSSC